WRASQAGGDVDDDLLTGHLPGVAVQELLAEPAADLVELTRRVEQARARWGVTADVVDAEAARINAVFGRRVVHRIGAPAREWFKAGQVRHAFDVLDDEMADWPALADCRYVGIYDFDARPCP